MGVLSPLSLPEFGRYVTIRLLGRGGMGEVYLAADPDLGRQVAIKVILHDAGGDAAHRLVLEARATAALDHECICAVYETGITPQGRAYIVMQYVPGETLQARLESGPLSAADAVSLCADIAGALDAAHRAGIVHRDLKPSNVIFAANGRPKLVDFGIAKWRQQTATDDPTTVNATASGTILGTFGYMSPEQMTQRPIDGRSDLFSLGAVFFECLTGQRAFSGSTPVERIAGVLNVEPPSIVRINPALTDRHAVVCSQLLAKSPADRFQSAAEALGALRLLSSSNGSTSAGGQPLGRRISRRSVMAAAGLLTLSLAVGYWATREVRLPSGPREAEGWYRRGTEQIREGAYQSARRALEQAVAIFPQHALAFSRLAEANAELDDQNAAREDLLRVTALVTDESRLAADDRMRLTAVRSLVLRDMDSAIAAYRELATRHPDDAGAWLDLGRAQDAAGLRNDARDSYLRAIARNKQYAPAYLRLAFEEAVASRFGEAEEALNQAEQLYVAASEIEGRAEVLLRRGSMLDSKGESKAARSALEQSLALSKSASAPFQQIRIRLALSCVIASEGRLKDSEVVASEAVQQAIDSGLQTVAAEGLVDLSATLLEAGRLDEAESQARRAVTLAEQRQARRTSARARVQLASVLQERGRAAETLAMLDSTLPFLLAGKYRRLELLALSIQSRAQQQLDRLDLARQVSGQILEVAELVKDEGQIAIAASNLASVMESLGQYPAALALRERAEQIHRRAEDRLVLPYDITNRAEVLIRLGRFREAETALSEVDAGIAAHVDTYVGRQPRVRFLRGLADAVNLRCDKVRDRFRDVNPASQTGSARALAPAIVSYCAARIDGPGSPVAAAVGATDRPALAREVHYWAATAAFERKTYRDALAEARQGLDQLEGIPNDELRWRLAAVGALAADAARYNEGATDLERIGRTAWERMKSEWGVALAGYKVRPDVHELRQHVSRIWNDLGN